MHTIWWSSPAAWPRSTSHHAAARSDAGVLAPERGIPRWSRLVAGEQEHPAAHARRGVGGELGRNRGLASVVIGGRLQQGGSGAVRSRSARASGSRQRREHVYEIVAPWPPTTSRSRSSSPTTTPSCAPGCGWCSSAPAASRSSRRPATPTRRCARCSVTSRRSWCSTSTCPASSSSLDAIPRVQEVSPDTHVVILTMQEDPEFARRALRAGAAGYVLKEAADDELVDAVRRVAEGGTYLNPRLGAVLAAAPPEPSGPPDDLTEREVEVLRLIALGHTNAEIAAGALPLGAHRRVASRPHPAEARPLHARRARPLRARPRVRGRELSGRGRSAQRQARADRGPGVGAGQHAELAPRQLDALAHAGQAEPGGLRPSGSKPIPSSATRDLELAARRSARAARPRRRRACLTTLVSDSWTTR